MSMTFLLTVPWSLPTNTCEYEDQPQSPRGLALFGRQGSSCIYPPAPICTYKGMFLVLTSDTRRSNQLILKEINLEYSLERLMLKLNLQYFGHLMQRADSLEKTLMLGKIEGNRRRGRQRMRGLNSITKSMDVNLSQLREIMKDRGAFCAIVHGVPKSRTQLIDRTTTS